MLDAHSRRIERFHRANRMKAPELAIEEPLSMEKTTPKFTIGYSSFKNFKKTGREEKIL